jgi:glycosyltransferase involved in cell wall biosynthesis
VSLRILHVSTRLILGGSQENTILSCEGQARRGHEVHLAFGPIYGPEGSMLERVRRFRTDDGRRVEAYELPSLVRQVNPLKDRRATDELRDLINEVRPDIIHTHSSKAGIIGRGVAWNENRKLTGDRQRLNASGGTKSKPLPAQPTTAISDPIAIVHTVHGPPFMPVDGSAVRRAKIFLINRGYIAAEKYAAKRCHMIVSVADAMTQLYLSKGIGRRGQYVTVYSGMETDRFLTAVPGEDRTSMRRALGFSDSDIVVGTVARLAEHKGHNDVLDALGADMMARRNLKLLWVGDGWWRERLAARARKEGFSIVELDRIGSSDTPNPQPPSGQVVLTGLVPPERVAAHIRAMDILVHASYREGLPRTVPQALLCDVAPVAYDVDGTREVCIEGRTGRLVPVGNRGALRQAVLELADSPKERARLAAEGRELCRVRFAADTMVEELEKVYQQALNSARRPS